MIKANCGESFNERLVGERRWDEAADPRLDVVA